jgi:hypothetical protein
MRGLALLAAAVLVLATGAARADRRVFAHAFQYGTEPEGDTSITLWHTEARPIWNRSTTALAHALQVQHGLTEHLDASLFATFAQVAATDPDAVRAFGLDDVRLLARYRFADRSEWPVDLQVQTQLARRFGQSVYDSELRVVLARDLGALAVAANVVAVYSTEARADLGWLAAASYELHPAFALGAEAFGQLDARTAFVGPVIAYAPARSLWLAASAARGLSARSDDLVVRVLLGLER